jgi:hypothetical protein
MEKYPSTMVVDCPGLSANTESKPLAMSDDSWQ